MKSRYARKLGCGSALLSSGLLVSSAVAQDVLAPPANPYPGQTPVAQLPGVNPEERSTGQEVLSGGEEVLKWGFARLHPSLLYRLYYGDGIQSAPGQSTRSLINEVAPGIELNLGNHWKLDYSPTFRFYSAKEFQDGVDHYASLTGNATYEDWTFGFGEFFAYTFQPTVQTGSQTGLGMLSTRLSATDRLGGSWSLEFGLNESSSMVLEDRAEQGLVDYNTWSTLDWLNYEFASKLNLALGVGAGYDDVGGGGSAMAFEQVQARASWRLSQKLAFSVNGGLEDRQFLDSEVSDKLNPVMGVALTYMPFESTTVTLQGNRASSPSYFRDELMDSTTVSASLNQRLLKRLHLILSGGYAFADYTATVEGVPVDRQDDYTFFNVRLSTGFLKRATASIFYQVSRNASNAQEFTYSSSQAGFEIGYRF